MARNAIQLGKFSLDLDGQTLVVGGRAIPLRQKAWLVLRTLAERPGVLLSADELHASAWPGLAVTPQTLTNVISELRKVSRLDPSGSLRIDTRYGRGYRLLVDDPPAQSTDERVDAPAPAAPPSPVAADAIFVGREHELERLATLWRLALSGQRQIVFVAGTAGIGKTTLIEAAITALEAGGTAAPLSVGRGRCVVRQGDVEPYAPLLDALEEISRQVDLIEELRRCAPSWLAQMPWLLPADEMMALRQSLIGTGTLRLLRDGIKLLEALAERQPLLLVLEDLHGADASTVDLLAALIERSAPARLMVLASYRPPDAFLRGGVLPSLPRQAQRAACVTRLVLEPLAAGAIDAYLRQRFADPGLSASIAPALEEKSGGNPLFLREIVDTLVEGGSLVEGAAGWRLEATLDALRAMLPDGVRELIGAHLAQLPAAQIELLEAASAAGGDFTVSLVAAALERPVEDVGRACRDLAAHSQFVADDGERAMPEGTVVEAYRFTHALYQQALAERLTPTLRRPLHARIGAQLEREYGSRTIEIAQRLALHFEAAEQREKQFVYLQFAVIAALERRAFRDVADLLRRAIEVSRLLPDTPEYGLRRAELLLGYGNTRGLLGGYADAAARDAYDAAGREAERLGDVVLRFRAQLGRCICALFRVAPEARTIADDLLAVAAGGHPELAAAAHLYNCYVAVSRADFAALTAHAEAAVAALPHAASDIPQGICLAARTEAQLADARVFAGDLDGARRTWWRAADIARERAISVDRVLLLASLAVAAVNARDAESALALAEEEIAVVDELGIDGLYFPLLADACRAWARCALGRGSVAELERVLQQRQHTGELWTQPLLLVALAECQLSQGDPSAARRSLAGAAAASASEISCLAEIERVEGDLAFAAGDTASARQRYEAALTIAQHQTAALFATRAREALIKLGSL